LKSVAKLRRIGFTITATHADTAVGCTQVVSASPFFFYNSNFVSKPCDIVKKLEAATEVSPGEFRLTIAGEYFGQDDELPYTLVLPASQKSLETYYRKYEAAKAEVDRLKQEVKCAEELAAFELETFEAVTKSIVEG
jgi:hypothetical protein